MANGDEILRGAAQTIELGGDLADTFETRIRLESYANPGCLAWRTDNPDPCRQCGHQADDHDERDEMPEQFDGCTRMSCPCVVAFEDLGPAPYCCSAYCIRCAGLRKLDNERQIIPNEWLDRA